MVQGIDEDLGLVLVGPDVVRDLRGPDLAVLVALPDRELLHDRGMVGDRLVELGHHLGVVVVPGVLRGETSGDGRGSGEQQETGKGGGKGAHGGQSDGSTGATSPPRWT